MRTGNQLSRLLFSLSVQYLGTLMTVANRRKFTFPDEIFFGFKIAISCSR